MQDVCVVVPLTSWQGGPLQTFSLAHPRCIPPARGSDQGMKPIPRASKTFDRSITTMFMETNLRSLDERHVMETLSARPGREHFVAALTLEPSHLSKGILRPCEILTNSTRFGCAPSCQRWIMIKGPVAPLETSSFDLETCLSTNTEPCTNETLD